MSSNYCFGRAESCLGSLHLAFTRQWCLGAQHFRISNVVCRSQINKMNPDEVPPRFTKTICVVKCQFISADEVLSAVFFVDGDVFLSIRW